jgi:hypothetical protein
MSKLKKIITGSLEIVKESAKQLGETVGPEALLKAAGVTPTAGKNEWSEYLAKEQSNPHLTGEKLVQANINQKQKDEEDQKKILASLPGLPDHMKPTSKTPEQSVYDANWEERMRIERDKKAASQNTTIEAPQGKKQAGSALVKKRAPQNNMEGPKQNIKAG